MLSFQNPLVYPDIIEVPASLTVQETIEAVLERTHIEDPFYVVHLDNVDKEVQNWRKCFPGIAPYYAVKVNDDVEVLRTLANHGIGFDCASKYEIELILSLGVAPDRIIYAHPVKSLQSLQYAASVGVQLMTADSCSEIHKIKEAAPNSKVILRLKCDHSHSMYSFGSKFGADHSESIEIINLAIEIGIQIVGVSFHVGNRGSSWQAFSEVLDFCAEIMKYGKSKGCEMTILDIGGGFPGGGDAMDLRVESFEDMSQGVLRCIKKSFSDFNGLTIIGEPGRRLCSSSCTIVVNVFGKKEYATQDQKIGYKYYIDAGVFGPFNGVLFFECMFNMEILKPRPGTPVTQCIIFGPTCDSIDKLGEIEMEEVQIGDRLFVRNIGAYTMTLQTNFNGFGNIHRVYVRTTD